MLNNAMLVGETRLQDTITGPARATVTSVLGLLEEVVALLVYAAFVVGSHVLGFPALVALLARAGAGRGGRGGPSPAVPPAGCARILRSSVPPS